MKYKPKGSEHHIAVLKVAKDLGRLPIYEFVANAENYNEVERKIYNKHLANICKFVNDNLK